MGGLIDPCPLNAVADDGLLSSPDTPRAGSRSMMNSVHSSLCAPLASVSRPTSACRHLRICF